MPKNLNRAKLSTTVAAETYRYLQSKVESGEAESIAEAVDLLIERTRQLENRERLARATSRYYDELDAKSLKEEKDLASRMSAAVRGMDFDHEL